LKQPRCNQLIVGLPSTGKTTFLAALWHVVESEEVAGSLCLEKLHGNREHLNAIRDNWLGCHPVARTTISSETLVSMILKAHDGGKTTEIFFPDMSGETFMSHWRDRKCTKDYNNIINQASGALLFIHPEQVLSPERIDDANKLASILEENADESGTITECSLISQEFESEHANDTNISAKDGHIQWNPDNTPTQVILVELLQFLAQLSDSPSTFRIAVIISAWDLISNQKLSPENWLANRLPLLDQYLKSNWEQFPTRVYGVSAQGTDYSKGNLKDLSGKLKQAERIIMEGEECKTHDITAPVKWVMNR